jgi:hypothetical protein
VLAKYAPLLLNGCFSERLVRKLLSAIEKITGALAVHELPISPFAWMDCFEETRGKSPDEMKQRLYRCLERAEKEAAAERKRKKQTIPDPERLATQNPFLPYKPKKFGRRVICICSCRQLRKAFIQLYRELCIEAREAYNTWQERFEDLPVPIGMFSPPRSPRGSVILPGEFS